MVLPLARDRRTCLGRRHHVPYRRCVHLQRVQLFLRRSLPCVRMFRERHVRTTLGLQRRSGLLGSHR